MSLRAHTDSCDAKRVYGQCSGIAADSLFYPGRVTKVSKPTIMQALKKSLAATSRTERARPEVSRPTRRDGTQTAQSRLSNSILTVVR